MLNRVPDDNYAAARREAIDFSLPTRPADIVGERAGN